MFISHAWATPGRLKVLSLLLHMGWRIMLTSWALSTVLCFALCLLNILPMPFRFERTSLGVPLPVGVWLTSAGCIFAILGLMVAPYMPACTSDKCFVDVACIHQADAVLMQQGISNIGGFLSASAELRVLWSEPYLSRFWCIFLDPKPYKPYQP